MLDVGAEGFEPSCTEAAGFKPAVSTGFTTRPWSGAYRPGRCGTRNGALARRGGRMLEASGKSCW